MGVGLRSARWEDELRLELDVRAAPLAVSEVRSALGQLPLAPPVLDDLRLLTSELLTNSIRHAGLGPLDAVRVLVRAFRGRLRVDVIDRARHLSPRRLAGAIRPDPEAESGWGLYLVECLSSRWGW